MRLKPASKKKRSTKGDKRRRAQRPDSIPAVASESESARLKRVLHERRLLALDHATWDYLERVGKAASVPAPETPRRPGPLSKLSDKALADHLKNVKPGATDRTGKRISLNARARMLGVSRWVLVRRAPDLAR